MLLQALLLKDSVRVISKRFSSAVSGFLVALKWVCALPILVGRLVGLSMFIIWASDCFVREFRTTALCEDFSLFPSPKIFESTWLLLCAITSSFFIFYVCCLNHFRGFLPVLKHLITKKILLEARCHTYFGVHLRPRDNFEQVRNTQNAVVRPFHVREVFCSGIGAFLELSSLRRKCSASKKFCNEAGTLQSSFIRLRA